MKIDPTVEKIRQIRNDISEECGHDPQKLINYYIKYQHKFDNKLIKRHNISLLKK